MNPIVGVIMIVAGIPFTIAYCIKSHPHPDYNQLWRYASLGPQIVFGGLMLVGSFWDACAKLIDPRLNMALAGLMVLVYSWFGILRLFYMSSSSSADLSDKPSTGVGI